MVIEPTTSLLQGVHSTAVLQQLLSTLPPSTELFSPRPFIGLVSHRFRETLRVCRATSGHPRPANSATTSPTLRPTPTAASSPFLGGLTHPEIFCETKSIRMSEGTKEILLLSENPRLTSTVFNHLAKKQLVSDLN